MRQSARRDGSKYRNCRTLFLGRWFDSAGEAMRYRELLLWGQAGGIRDLELQPRFPLHVNGVKIGEYRADFRYKRPVANLQSLGVWWQDVVEDYKGMATLPLARWKHKHLKAEYGIAVEEVRA